MALTYIVFGKWGTNPNINGDIVQPFYYAISFYFLMIR